MSDNDESTDFHLPYNFVPVDTRKTTKVPAADIVAGASTHPARHDVWTRQRYSGSIVCHLRTDSPVVIGARQDRSAQAAAGGHGRSRNEQPASVEPYRSGGRVAIPGSSLRGMISAVAEAMSQSSLRKLGPLSKRNGPADGDRNVLHDAFRRGGGDDAVPWGARWRGAAGSQTRTQLTPAELLFGMAADQDIGDTDHPLAALAGRVRFGDALPPPRVEARLQPAVTLQLLGSPKPPSPAFYFSQRENRAIAKKDFDPTRYVPNGRKVYVPHRKPAEKEPWRHVASGGEGDGMRLRVEPIAPDSTFYFSVEFDHLHKGELNLLLLALQPDTGVLHRLGLGKPLGLGHVQIQIKAVCRFIRANRYRAPSLEAHRYEDVQTVPGFERDDGLRAWLDQPQYRPEFSALYVNKIAKPKLAGIPAQGFDDPGLNLVDRRALDILRTAGNRKNLVAPTHYPRCIGTGDTEENLYEWNASNEAAGTGKRQWLKPVTPGQKLPTLARNTRKKRK